jgi:hypothetical protein
MNSSREGIAVIVAAIIVGTISWNEYVTRPVGTVAELRCGDKTVLLRTNVFGDTLVPKCNGPLYVEKLYDQGSCGEHWYGVHRMTWHMTSWYERFFCLPDRSRQNLLQQNTGEQPQLEVGPFGIAIKFSNSNLSGSIESIGFSDIGAVK